MSCTFFFIILFMINNKTKLAQSNNIRFTILSSAFNSFSQDEFNQCLDILKESNKKHTNT